MICQQRQSNKEYHPKPFLTLVTEAPRVNRRPRHRGKASIKVAERLLFVAAISSLLWLGASSASGYVESFFLPPAHTQLIKVTVEPGDTLWSIAGAIKNNEVDQSAMVDEIRSANPKTAQNPQIQPGQTLLLPMMSNSTR